MGGLQWSQSKRELRREHFQQFYEQTISSEYFPFVRSCGYRPISIEKVEKRSLPLILTNPAHEVGIKKQGARMLKKRAEDLSVYPYSCIGLLLVYFDQILKCGTGSLIGKNLILTAASNIFERDSQRLATSIKFVLGVDGQSGQIYDVCPEKVYFHEKFSEEAEGSHRYNYAVLQLDGETEHFEGSLKHGEKGEGQLKQGEKGVGCLEGNPGLTHGYLGYFTLYTGSEPVYIFGYSSAVNKNEQIEYNLRGQKIDMLICKSSSLGYKMQSFASEAGSPIMIRRNEEYQVVGIHICGAKGLGSGLQFDERIRGDINSWVCSCVGSIDLSQKQMSAFEVGLFSALSWHNMSLINLNNNNIGCEGVVALTKAMWPMLRELHLDRNNIGKLQFNAYAIKNVQKLFLNDNQIKNIAVLAELPLLRVLSLAGNRVQTIEDLFQLVYMQRLDLSTANVMIGSNRLKALPVQIARLCQLRKLYLSRNQLECIPANLLKLRSLSVLAVDGNRLLELSSELIFRLQGRNVQVIV